MTASGPSKIVVAISPEGLVWSSPADQPTWPTATYVPSTEAQPEPGVMHPIDRAFYDLTVKERDYARRACGKAEAALQEAVELLRICGPSADPSAWHRVMEKIDPTYRASGPGRWRPVHHRAGEEGS